MANRTVTASDLHDLQLFFQAVLVYFFDPMIGDFLEIFFAALQIIFGDKFLLFEITHVVMQVTPHIADRNAAFLEAMVNDLSPVHGGAPR